MFSIASWLHGLSDVPDEPKAHPFRRHRWALDIKDYGYAECQVANGDLDGSGATPGVQLEFEHEFSHGRQALAMSADEAESLSRALAQAARAIRPSERLRSRRRWRKIATNGETLQGRLTR